MYRAIFYSAALSFFLFPASAYAGWFGPSDFSECIIEGMEGVQSDLAARMVRQACLEKFPLQKEKTPESTEMPTDVVAELSVHGRSVMFGHFSGEIYNGTSDWTVTEFTIIIYEVAVDSNGLFNPFEDLLNGRKYLIRMTVAPYTNEGFSLSLNGPKNVPYQASISDAKGYRNIDPR